MDYYSIGKRIRSARKANLLSQEELAEKIDISVTHMSHIETGNTKLSLPVMVDISKVLNVRIDDIVFENHPSEKKESLDNILRMLSKCSQKELSVLEDVIKALIISIEKNS